MNEVSLSQKVSDAALTSIALQGAPGATSSGLMAVGDADGTITLVQLCDSLNQPAPNEKNLIGAMFDRETKREKNLEAIKKAAGSAKKPDAAGGPQNINIDEKEYVSR